MCIGLFFTGLSLGPLIIPNMAEMIVAAQIAFPDIDYEHANSLIGGMLNSAYGVGGAIGPIIGSILYQFIGFQQMCDVVGGICILYSAVYFIACSGWEGFQSSFNRRENRGR